MITPPSENKTAEAVNPASPSLTVDFPPIGESVATQETIVVPPVGTTPAPNTPLEQGTEVPPPPVPTQPNPWPKRILVISLLLFFLIGAILGGRYVFALLSGPKEVTISYWGLWENDGVMRPIIADFEAKNPHIKVAYSKQSQRQYRERLQAAIESDSGPDVFRFHNTWVPMLKNQLAAVPETVMSLAQFDSLYYPVAKRDLTAGSVLYGIPLMIEGLGLFYNEDLFAAAGVTAPPTTWPELLEVIPKLSKPEGNGFAVSAIALGTTGNIENFSDIIAVMFMQNGANLADPMKTKQQAEEVLGFYRRFATPTEPVYTWNETMDNSMYAFAIGKVAMVLAPSWRAFDIIEMAKTAGNPNMRFKIVPIPQLPGNTVTWASYWVEGVSERSKNKTAAFEFLKYLTSRDVMTMLYAEESKVRLFGEPYARKDMAGLISEDPYVGAYIKQAATAYSFPLSSRTFDNGINDQMAKYVENAVNALGQGSSPAQEIEATIARGFVQVLSKYGLITSTATQVQ